MSNNIRPEAAPPIVQVNHNHIGKIVSYSAYDASTFDVPVKWAIEIIPPIMPENKPITCDYFSFHEQDELSRRLDGPNGSLLVNVNGGYSDIRCNVGVLRHDFERECYYKSLMAVSGRFGISTAELYYLILESASSIEAGLDH